MRSLINFDIFGSAELIVSLELLIQPTGIGRGAVKCPCRCWQITKSEKIIQFRWVVAHYPIMMNSELKPASLWRMNIDSIH